MKNNKGFTLVELLAVIVILSIVLGITGYVAVGAIKKAKDKTKEVTINNIEKSANDYVTENSGLLSYVTSADDSAVEYQCVTVGELIDAGYLKNDIINNTELADGSTVTRNDYIYIERDANNKTVTKIKYKDTNVDCGYAHVSQAGINFSINPAFGTWSETKTVTIAYSAETAFADEAGSIQYTYRLENTSGTEISSGATCTSGCDDESSHKVLTATQNDVVIHAFIKNNGQVVNDRKFTVIHIDNNKPTISYVNNSGTVTSPATIQLRVVDNESGNNYTQNNSSFTKDKLTVKIGTYQVPSSNVSVSLNSSSNSNEGIYNVTINDSTHSGTVSIDVAENAVYDNSNNGNAALNLPSSISFNTKYTITYDSNGGDNCSPISKEVTNGGTYGTLCSPTRTGYAFDGWYTSGTGGNNITASTTVNLTGAQTLYAHWTAKSIMVTFACNGGTGGGNATYTYGVANQQFPNPALCSRSGYTASGWTRPDGGVHAWTSYINDQWIDDVYENRYGNSSHNITLTAKWKTYKMVSKTCIDNNTYACYTDAYTSNGGKSYFCTEGALCNGMFCCKTGQSYAGCSGWTIQSNGTTTNNFVWGSAVTQSAVGSCTQNLINCNASTRGQVRVECTEN